MKKKRNILIGILATILLIVIIGLVITNNSSNGEMYRKYQAKVTINFKSSDVSEVLYLVIKDDGENASVLSSKFGNPGYILKKDLYYLRDDIYYIYSSDKTYRDFYKLVSGLDVEDKIKNDEEYTYYSKVLKDKEIDDILESLYINKRTKSSKVAEVIKKGNSVMGFDLAINDIEGYDMVEISATFEEIDDSFNIDTSIIRGNDVGGFGNSDYKKYEHTDENIFEIVK